MTIIKILKNVSGETRQILKRDVLNNESFNIPYNFWFELAANEAIKTWISNGDVVVNDGENDLSISEGLEHVERFQIDNADKITFDNSTNGFVSENVQEAIEEIVSSPVGTLDIYEFSELGSATNEWLEYGNSSINSDESPAVLPFNVKLIGCTFTNSNDGVDTDIEVHRSSEGQGSTSSRVATFQVRNRRVARFTNFTQIQFFAGDKISLFMRDQGDNPADVVVKLYFLITGFNQENSAENYSSNTSLSIGGITITIG